MLTEVPIRVVILHLGGSSLMENAINKRARVCPLSAALISHQHARKLISWLVLKYVTPWWSVAGCRCWWINDRAPAAHPHSRPQPQSSASTVGFHCTMEMLLFFFVFFGFQSNVTILAKVEELEMRGEDSTITNSSHSSRYRFIRFPSTDLSVYIAALFF
jgi:hypothetical protein